MLSEEQVQLIHGASLEILQRVGYHVPVSEARKLLLDAGATVKGERVFIPPDLVERALKTLRPVTLYNRLGEAALPLTVGQGQVTFGAMVDTMYVVDPYQRALRRWQKDDLLWFATVLDALPNIDWVACIGEAQDVPDTLQSQIAVTNTLRKTGKPVLVFPYDRKGLLDIIDVVSIVASTEEDFQRKPFLFCASVPAAPLRGADYNLELLLTCAERQIPLLYYSSPAIGANSPCSVAGALLAGNADWLASLTIHQLKHPGAPFCAVGFTAQLMDMRTTLWSYCAPEMLNAYAAVADLAHWYGMPAFGLEMTSDVPRLDAQAGAEMMAQCLWAFQSGVEMVHNAGMFGSNKIFAAEANVLADEIIAYTRAALRPVRVSLQEINQSLALIEEVGPLGEYFTHEDTLRRFKDFWYPSVFDRPMFDPQGILGPDLEDRLNQRTRNLIETHQPAPLAPEVEKEMATLEKSWYARLGV